MHKCEFCQKVGHTKSRCFANPDSLSFKGPAGNGTGIATRKKHVQQVSGDNSGGNVNLIDDGDSPSESDELVESVLSGNVFSIPGSTNTQSSPYVNLQVAATLTHTDRQQIARACADTESANNFCPESLTSKVMAII